MEQVINSYADEMLSSGRTRCFNSIELDTQRGIVTKTSSETSKLLDEIRWYLNLPSELSYVIPRVFDHSLDKSRPFISLEYYGYRTLSNYLVDESLPLTEWKKAFGTLFFFVSEMSHYKTEIGASEIRFCIQDMYVGKTLKRLHLLAADKRFENLFGDVWIDGKLYQGLDYCLSTLDDVMIDFGMYDVAHFPLIHGDLCLSNILYDPYSGAMRLIDPRGSFGTQKMYGDLRYDFAKLLHSIHGGYDFIINNKYAVTFHQNKFELCFPEWDSNLMTNLTELFSSYEQKFNISPRQVQLIESLLFLSMAALHRESYYRQVAMLVNGIRMFHHVLEGKE